VRPRAAQEPGLEGLSALDVERAESMASEGGRSAQVVSAALPTDAAPRRWPMWLALLTTGLVALAGYRRLQQSR
jgi:hypothetical protein